MADIRDYRVYNDRMRRSMWDKAFFMDKIPRTELIVDYGCADGSLIRFLHDLFPDMQFIGFDIDPVMIAAAGQHRTENAWFFSDMDCVAEKIRDLGLDGSCTAINFSSVFHEIFHYGFDLAFLERCIRSLNPRYLVVRDMMYESADDSAPVSPQAEELVRRALPDWQIRDFEDCFGTIHLRRNLVHLLLKYSYTENWSRECAENYFSVTESALNGVLNPFGRYRTILYQKYMLPWCRYDIENRFGIDPGQEFTTHFQMILSARLETFGAVL